MGRRQLRLSSLPAGLLRHVGFFKDYLADFVLLLLLKRHFLSTNGTREQHSRGVSWVSGSRQTSCFCVGLRTRRREGRTTSFARVQLTYRQPRYARQVVQCTSQMEWSPVMSIFSCAGPTSTFTLWSERRSVQGMCKRIEKVDTPIMYVQYRYWGNLTSRFD